MRPRRARIPSIAPRLATLNTDCAKPPPKTADPHYLTPEHRAWRDKVIERAGNCCQGTRPDGRPCRRTGVRLFADHIVERKDGGDPFDLANGQALCGSCHGVKTSSERAKRHTER